MGPDPDPALFVINLQDANKKLRYFFLSFLLITFEGIFTVHHSSKIKSHKILETKGFLASFN